MAFTNLAHHIDITWLRKAYDLTRKDGAVGVDGQTAADYEVNLMGNLQDLLIIAQVRHVRGTACTTSAHSQAGLA